MSRATAEQMRIFQSHKILSFNFDLHVINNLLHLFDNTRSNNAIVGHHITDYIKEAHKLKGINMRKNNLRVISVVDGISSMHDITKFNPSCIVKILYKGLPLVHLTIHLLPLDKSERRHGMIHLVKDHHCKSLAFIPEHGCRVRILIEPVQNKPDSLTFTAVDDIPTPHGANTSIDHILHLEMQILMDVLNNLFDQSATRYYIGRAAPANRKIVNMNHSVPLLMEHAGTNPSAKRMNQLHITRKNKGSLYPSIANLHPSLHAIISHSMSQSRIPSSTAATTATTTPRRKYKSRRKARTHTTLPTTPMNFNANLLNTPQK